MALASRGDGLVLVDERGRVLPVRSAALGARSAGGGHGDSLVTGVLARMRESDPDLFARIGAAWRVRADVVLEVGGGASGSARRSPRRTFER